MICDGIWAEVVTILVINPDVGDIGSEPGMLRLKHKPEFVLDVHSTFMAQGDERLCGYQPLY